MNNDTCALYSDTKPSPAQCDQQNGRARSYVSKVRPGLGMFNPIRPSPWTTQINNSPVRN